MLFVLAERVAMRRNEQCSYHESIEPELATQFISLKVV